MYSYFNPRARVGRDDFKNSVMTIRSPFQSTRPRGARPPASPAVLATSNFNPRARVGRDAFGVTGELDRLHFNPRARVGRDPQIAAADVPADISIHAPAWGATAGFTQRMLSVVFQSTRPRGARLDVINATNRGT